MGKTSKRSIVLGVYRRLIVKYHRLGKDTTRLMERLKMIALKDNSL